jgi:WD40 repeat protein
MTYVWNIDQDRQEHKFDNGSAAVIPVAVFSPDGKSIVTGDIDGKLRFWPQDNAEPWAISAHQGPINWVEFSPDGPICGHASDAYLDAR